MRPPESTPILATLPRPAAGFSALDTSRVTSTHSSPPRPAMCHKWLLPPCARYGIATKQAAMNGGEVSIQAMIESNPYLRN